MVRISDNGNKLEISLNAFRWSTITQKQFIKAAKPLQNYLPILINNKYSYSGPSAFNSQR